MTEETARKVANVALGVAAVGAAYFVARTPPLAANGPRAGDDGADGRAAGLAGARSAACLDGQRAARRLTTRRARYARDMMSA